MKLSNVLFLATLIGETVASWGFGKSAYNKWHENELERWLSDHDIDYPKPADRKDLEKLVQDNWQMRVVDVYSSWDIPQLQNYLVGTGRELDKKQKQNRNWLVQQVKIGWHETEKTAESAYHNVKDWIFDSWTDSQLKQFLDRHGIPNPTPRTHESLVGEARKNYLNIAEKLGESTEYPGNWLYESWSESDLKRWLDERGYPVPQPTTRDKLIASVRRNSRLAALKAKKEKESSKHTISDSIFDTWSESKLKEFLEKNKVKIPKGSTMNELLALARRNKHYLAGDQAYQAATGVFDQATSTAANMASQATDTAKGHKDYAFDTAIEIWSDSRLKAFLDSRGIPVPQNSKRDELLAHVRRNKHKAASGLGVWTFETWSYDNLKNWLESQGHKVSGKAAASREELASQAWSYVNAMSASAASATHTASSSGASAGSKVTEAAANASSRVTDAMGDAASKVSGAASKATDAAESLAQKAGGAAENVAHKAGDSASEAGGYAADAGRKAAGAAVDGSKQAYESLTSAISQATASAKDTAFENWSDSDLKAYLDSYGIKTYQGSTRNELIAMARRNAHYFMYGGEDQGVCGYFMSTLKASKDFVMSILGKGSDAVGDAANTAQEKAKAAQEEASTRAKKAYAGAKNEL